MSTNVLMPVYNASAIVARTLKYLLHTGVPARSILVADDASTEQRMRGVQAWAESEGVRWDRASANRGYTRNINAALRSVASEHVLILNSDCFVSRSTIEELESTLRRFDMIGCVGPLSSNAGHQSVRLKRTIFWEMLTDSEIERLSRKVEEQLLDEFGGRPWLMPTANGFCCLWRTSVLQDLGFFDEEEFPRGYGEEDDICLRMMEYGRFAAIAPHTFAPHLKTKSFSLTEREHLKSQAQTRLRMKFSSPHIDRLVNHYVRHPHIADLARTVLGAQEKV